MKNIAIVAFTLLTAFGSLNARPVKKRAAKKHTTTVAATEDKETYIKAIRLINLPDGGCSYEVGKIPNKTNMDVKTFFAQTHVDAYEKVPHAAPRKQYVVTLKGKLRFKVTNGDTFIVEPGVVLIAEDTQGKGHTWDLVHCKGWERLYIPLNDGADDHFIKD